MEHIEQQITELALGDMYNVYILTKEGRVYSDEGIEIVQTMLAERHNISEEMIFHQGAEFNKPEFLIECLTKNPDVAIVISIQGGTYTVIGEKEHLNTTIPLLKNHPNETCWETILGAIQKSSCYKE